MLKTSSCMKVVRSPLISQKVVSTQFSPRLVYVTTDRPQRVREAVINPHMTSSPGVTNDSLQFITCRQKRWRNRGEQHRKIITDDEAQISVNGNPGHRSITFNCFLCNLYVFVIKGSLLDVDLLCLSYGKQVRIRGFFVPKWSTTI